MKQWGFQNIRVDEQFTTLDIGAERVLTITIDCQSMKYTWNSAWQNWKEFKEDKDVLAIFEKAEKTLQNKGKGLSKGK